MKIGICTFTQLAGTYLPYTISTKYTRDGLLVGPLNGLLHGLEALDGLDWTEDLLPADPHVVCHVSEHRRLHEVSLLAMSGEKNLI